MATLSDDLRGRGVFRDLTATLQGHRKPDLAGLDATFFIHTASCIYALDEDGVCRYVVASDGSTLDHLDRCHGAQYVACLDTRTEQALVADPRAGAHALFVGRGNGQRVALMKTPPITRIVHACGDVIDEVPVKASELGWVDRRDEQDWVRATRNGHLPVVPKNADVPASARPLKAPLEGKPVAPRSSPKRDRPRIPRPNFRSSHRT